jgi:hypothetical protein
LVIRLALLWPGSSIRPGHAAVIRIGHRPAIERRLQDAVENIGEPARTIR